MLVDLSIDNSDSTCGDKIYQYTSIIGSNWGDNKWRFFYIPY